MKTVIANKFETAVKLLEEQFGKEVAEALKKEIPEGNKRHYNCLMVKIIDRPGQVKNDVKVNTMTYDKGRFERMTKNYQFHDFSAMIVLHDPTEIIKSDKPFVPAFVQQKTEAEIRKEVEAENEAKIKQRVAEALEAQDEANAGAPGDTTGDAGDEALKIDLAKMSFADKKEFAKANEIDITGLNSNSDLELVIGEWLKEQSEEA